MKSLNMKKVNIIYCFLCILTIFLIGCSDKTSKDAIIRLNVDESYGNGFIATDDKAGRYDIPNSNFKITDNNGDNSSWDELEKAKVIEVHFSGTILERNPAVLDKITKVVIIS